MSIGCARCAGAPFWPHVVRDVLQQPIYFGRYEMLCKNRRFCLCRNVVGGRSLQTCDNYPTSHGNGSPGALQARQDGALTVWALVYDDRLSERKTTVHYPRGRGGGEVGHGGENVGTDVWTIVNFA